jgi:hypothetical protein
MYADNHPHGIGRGWITFDSAAPRMDLQDSNFEPRSRWNMVDSYVKLMLIPCIRLVAAKFPAWLLVHFILHDENSLASTLWKGAGSTWSPPGRVIGRFVVTRLETNPNSEEALT